MTKIKAIAAGVSALALLMATPVLALAVSTNMTGDSYVDTGTSSSVGVGVNVGVSGSGDTSSGVGSGNSSSGMNASDDMNASENASADLSVPLVVTRADVDDKTIQASDVSARNVQTKDDLSGYIAAQMKSDTDLSAVDTASDHVAVTYPEHAHLLGFIPVTIETTATTDASGNVSITQPWWSFLAASDQSTLQANVQSSVSGVLGANASANAQLTASQQAELVAAIKSALSAAASADASASANASGNVNAQ